MNDIAIHVENLGKQYKIGLLTDRYRTLRDSLAQGLSSPLRRFRRAGLQ